MGPDPQPSDSAAPQSTGPGDRSTTFQPTEGGPQVHSGTTLMVEAYAVIWALLAAWILIVWRKQAGMNARLDDLEREIDKAAASAEGRAEKKP